MQRVHSCTVMFNCLQRNQVSMASNLILCHCESHFSLSPLQDPGFAALLLDKLQAVEWPPRGRGAESCCEVCGIPLHQLRRLALHSALGLGLNDVPDLQPGQFSGLLSLHSAAHSVLSPHPSWDWPKQSPLSAARQHPSGSHGEPAAGEKHREMGWIKSGAEIGRAHV